RSAAGVWGAARACCSRTPRQRGTASRRRVFSSFSPAGSAVLGDLQLLPGEDLVRVLDDVGVGLEDPLPLVRVAVGVLGDLRQAVTRLDLVGLVDLRRGSGR